MKKEMLAKIPSQRKIMKLRNYDKVKTDIIVFLVVFFNCTHLAYVLFLYGFRIQRNGTSGVGCTCAIQSKQAPYPHHAITT